MDRRSGIDRSAQSNLAVSQNRPDTSRDDQTITQTQGLKDIPEQAVPSTSLSERVTTTAQPASYLSWVTAPVKEVARAAVSFSYDITNTAYQTLTEGWSSIGQGATEVSKFGIGTLGLAASLAQAGLATAAEFADTKGIAIPDSKVDMIGWALAKAGIKTVGVPKSELRQLGISLARLHMGKQQNINITQGKLELTSANDSSTGLRWSRSHKSGTSQASSLQVQAPHLASNQPNNDAPIIRVSNIHLEGIQPGAVRPAGTDRTGNSNVSLSIKADRLTFEVEYEPVRTTGDNNQNPVILSIEISRPEFIGESNLLSLIATSINRYCSGLKHHLFGTPITEDNPRITEPDIWDYEDTGAQLKSKSAHIEVRNLKSLAPDISDYIPDVTSLSLFDLNTGISQSP